MTDREMMPGAVRVPCIVYVLPEPVCPYAKIVASNPLIALCTSSATSSKTLS